MQEKMRQTLKKCLLCLKFKKTPYKFAGEHLYHKLFQVYSTNVVFAKLGVFF